MTILVVYSQYTPSNDPRNGVSDPADFWAWLFILGGAFALILGLTDWRLGLWLKEYDVRFINLVAGASALLLGIAILKS